MAILKLTHHIPVADEYHARIEARLTYINERHERIMELAEKTEAALRAADVYRGEMADKPLAACEWYAMTYSAEAFRVAREVMQ